MLISFNILKNFIEIPKNISPKDVGSELTKSTVEVEKIIDKSGYLKNIYTAKVENILKHPNADKLKLADVLVGEKKFRVVCGGINLREGMITAVALPGAQIRWHGKDGFVELKKTEIRGEKSAGMICAANEIGLYETFPHADMEIMDLSDLNLTVGADLSDALGLNDVIFMIDNKSITNRPDLWSHWGIAREIAAIFNLKLREPKLYNQSALNDARSDVHTKLKIQSSQLKVNIEDYILCPVYFGCVVDDLEIKESPAWLKNVLISLGQKPINNIVDITNYVMFEIGEPLHAFDKDKMDGIVVRRAGKGESMITLDEVERKLDESDLVVADFHRAQSLAGLKGGLLSGVTQKTKSIILEAANFDALTIRRMGLKHGLKTEGSNRWEKGLHPHLAEIGMRRALQLILEVCHGAKISSVIIENKNSDLKPITVETTTKFIQNRIGKKISEKEIVSILSKLGFKVSIKNLNNSKFKLKTSKLFIGVPWWRSTGDILIEEDIVEEVARIYGYDNLAKTHELIELTEAKHQPQYDFEIKIKNYLSVGCGMSEVFNYPWASKKILDSLGINDEKHIEIAHPSAEDNKFLKTSLLSGLIKNVEDNLRFSSSFKLFELARVYLSGYEKFAGDDKLPQQPKMLSGAVVTKADPFLEIKGIVEGIADFKFKTNDFRENELISINRHKSLVILCGQEKIGWLGELKDGYYEKFGFRKKKIAFFEIDFNKLISSRETLLSEKKYSPISEYPCVERDLAFELNYTIKWRDILNEIEGFDALIEHFQFLSVYDLINGKKSLAFRIKYHSNEKTLTDKEVVDIESKIIEKLQKKFAANLRK